MILHCVILLFGLTQSMWFGDFSTTTTSHTFAKKRNYNSRDVQQNHHRNINIPGKTLIASEIVYQHGSWYEKAHENTDFAKIQEKCLGRGSYGCVYRIVKKDGSAKTVGKFFDHLEHAQEEWLNYARLGSKNIKHLLQPTGLYRVDKNLAKKQYRFDEFDERSGKVKIVQREFFMEMKECIPITSEDINRNLGNFVSQVMSAYNELYSNGWSHLDIKRENMMWSADLLVFIDLGHSMQYERGVDNAFFGNALHSSPYANRMNKFVLDLYTFRYSKDMITQELKMNDFWSIGIILADTLFGASFHTFVDTYLYQGKRYIRHPRYDVLSPSNVNTMQIKLNQFLDKHISSRLKNTFIEYIIYGALTIDPFLREACWKMLSRYIGYYNASDLVSTSSVNLRNEMTKNHKQLQRTMPKLEDCQCFRKERTANHFKMYCQFDGQMRDVRTEMEKIQKKDENINYLYQEMGRLLEKEKPILEHFPKRARKFEASYILPVNEQNKRLASRCRSRISQEVLRNRNVNHIFDTSFDCYGRNKMISDSSEDDMFDDNYCYGF